MKALKPRPCGAPGCEVEFTPTHSTTQKVCSSHCAIVLDNYKKQVKREKETRKELKALNSQSLSWQHEQTQREFNKFVRMRDHDQPCISCGLINVRFDAGHYRSKGAAPQLRYHEDNCHKQCSMNCNHMQSGNAIDYRIGLIAKIGAERVEAIEADNDPRKYTCDDLEALRAYYVQKTKELKAELREQAAIIGEHWN